MVVWGTQFGALPIAANLLPKLLVDEAIGRQAAPGGQNAMAGPELAA